MDQQHVNYAALELLKDYIEAAYTEHKEDRGGYWKDTERTRRTFEHFIQTKHPDLSAEEVSNRASFIMYLFMARDL